MRRRQTWSETLIVEKKASPGFLPSRERGKSTALFRDAKRKSRQGRGRRRGSLLPTSKKGAPMTMEPLVYLLATATTLASRLAYLRQAMATLHLHVVYASVSISILLDMGGARLISNWS